MSQYKELKERMNSIENNCNTILDRIAETSEFFSNESAKFQNVENLNRIEKHIATILELTAEASGETAMMHKLFVASKKGT